MTPEERKRMNVLCNRIQEEKDYTEFETILQDLNELIYQKTSRFPQASSTSPRNNTRPWKKLAGSVTKIIPNHYPDAPEHVEIIIEEAQPLFCEVRMDNAFTDMHGHPVGLKQGAQVDVTFEVDAKDTVKRAKASA